MTGLVGENAAGGLRRDYVTGWRERLRDSTKTIGVRAPRSSVGRR